MRIFDSFNSDKVLYFFKRLLSGFFDIIIIYILSVLLIIIDSDLKTKKDIFIAILSYYFLISIIWIFPLSLLHKNKKNIGYLITKIYIIDNKSNEIPGLFKLINRNFLMLFMISPFFILNIFGFIILILSVLVFFLLRKYKKGSYIWDIACNTSIEIEKKHE